MTNKITHVTNEGGDYEALYLNGKIVLQQTSIPISEMKEVTEQNQPFVIENIEVTEAWIENEGGMYPDTVDEIPLEAHSS